MSERRDRRGFEGRYADDERRRTQKRNSTGDRRRRDPERYSDDRRRRTSDDSSRERRRRDMDEYSDDRRRTKERRHPSSKRHKKKKWWKVPLIILVTLFTLCVVGIIGGSIYYKHATGESIIESYQEAKAIAAASTEADFLGASKTYIYGADGTEIAELTLDTDSSYLTYEQIPDDVINAFVAIEDRTFWTNSGIDAKGIARILFNYVRTLGKTKQGASTITQQLVKLTYLTTDRTISRKFKEIIIAREITKKYRKEDIITYYCNICCFANGIYGISDASEAYFDKLPNQLTLSETAYLCAIPNWPEQYNPYTNPDNALNRRDKILDDMCEMGYISQSECNAAQSEQIVIQSKSEDDEDYNYETTYAMHCATQYIMELQEFEFRYSFSSDADYQEYQTSYNEAYSTAKHELYTGGYRIYTTIDVEKQKELQAILDEGLADKETMLDTGIYQVQGSMTVIDNDTGKVVAVIGGRSQDELKGTYTLNRAYQGYAQPGSSIKPLIIYAAAMDSGEYTPTSVLKNVDVTEAKEEELTVEEIAQMDGDEVTLRSAVERSLNGCAYWLFSQIGMKKGLSYIQNMGFSKVVPGDENISAALGGMNYGATTVEMANAYYTLANDGVYQKTDCIEAIYDRYDHDIYRTASTTQVYSEEAAKNMTSCMMGVMTRGTAAGGDWYEYSSTEAAGKTGTTNDNKAGWFCGYTPYYTIAVWVGCDTPTEINGLSGNTYPLTIWRNSMAKMIEGKPTKYFDVVSPWEEETEASCICSTKCHEDHPNEDCPVCRYDISACEGEEESCICTTRCDGDSLNEACAVCMRDINACQGKELVCVCTDRCTADSIDEDCEFCQHDYTACQGTSPTTAEDPDDDDDETEAPETRPSDSGDDDDDDSYDPGGEDLVDPPEPDEEE